MVVQRRVFFAFFIIAYCSFINAEYRIPSISSDRFSHTMCKVFNERELQLGQPLVWQKEGLAPFNELIISWNGLRPMQGYVTIYVSVKYGKKWSEWHRLAKWGPKCQRTFINNAHPFVHTKHCRIEMQRGVFGRGFRAKIEFRNGAHARDVKALFACTSRLDQVQIIYPHHALPTTVIKNIPRQSQMVLNHERFKDLCSPASTSMLVAYFYKKIYGQKLINSMHDFVIDFAEKVHDQHINIYGNWILNVAHAFDKCHGNVYFRVERLNSFYDLHHHLSRQIPVAVSVRRLRGGATPYSNGHLMVVVGWNAQKRHVLCIDPAFENNKSVLRAYRINDFLRAWNRSNNLSYVPMLKDMLG